MATKSNPGWARSVRAGEAVTETPAVVVEQARRVRGWSLISHRASTNGEFIHVELLFENRSGFTPPTARQLPGTSGLRVWGVRSSVMHGQATVWVTCTQEFEEMKTRIEEDSAL